MWTRTWTVDGEKWTVYSVNTGDSEQWIVDYGPWAVDSGKWTVDRT